MSLSNGYLKATELPTQIYRRNQNFGTAGKDKHGAWKYGVQLSEKFSEKILTNPDLGGDSFKFNKFLSSLTDNSAINVKYNKGATILLSRLAVARSKDTNIDQNLYLVCLENYQMPCLVSENVYNELKDIAKNYVNLLRYGKPSDFNVPEDVNLNDSFNTSSSLTVDSKDHNGITLDGYAKEFNLVIRSEYYFKDRRLRPKLVLDYNQASGYQDIVYKFENPSDVDEGYSNAEISKFGITRQTALELAGTASLDEYEYVLNTTNLGTLKDSNQNPYFKFDKSDITKIYIPKFLKIGKHRYNIESQINMILKYPDYRKFVSGDISAVELIDNLDKIALGEANGKSSARVIDLDYDNLSAGQKDIIRIWNLEDLFNDLTTGNPIKGGRPKSNEETQKLAEYLGIVVDNETAGNKIFGDPALRDKIVWYDEFETL